MQSSNITHVSTHSPNSHCMLVTHLAPNIVYEFRVQAETAGGRGPFSNSSQFTTPEDGMIIIISTSAWLSEFMSHQCFYINH